MTGTLKVVSADPCSPIAEPLLQALWAYHQERTPVEGQFWLGAEELSASEIKFFLAMQHDEAVGCAAFSDQSQELKAMFVAPKARGSGAAKALIKRIEQIAAPHGIVRLETGPTHFAAIKFYEKAGYTHCERFGAYAGNDYSVCMVKKLPHTAHSH